MYVQADLKSLKNQTQTSNGYDSVDVRENGSFKAGIDFSDSSYLARIITLCDSMFKSMFLKAHTIHIISKTGEMVQ